MFWQREIETMPRDEIRKMQLTRLQAAVKRCYERVPLYRAKFEAAGIVPQDIRTLSDLHKIPFTVKDDFRENYPFGMFAAPMEEIVRIHASSGTTGKPTVVGYTRQDLDIWSDLVARLATAAGASSKDIVQIAFGYGLFTGAFGLHYGLEKIGATIVPMSSGNTEKQLMLMQDFGTTLLVATPSYALYLSEVAKEMGIRDKLKLRIGLFGAEGCTDEMRAQIEENFGILATDNYGMSELIGPGVAGECELRCGLHLAEDHFIAEIIDPETGEVLPEGETGELVITAMTKQALPVLRYRTRDITRLITEPCACGRTHARIDKVRGRSDDMLIIKGVNVFPSQIETVIMGTEHIAPHYLLVIRRKDFKDTLEVQVELKDGTLLERYGELLELEKTVHHRLQSVLGLDAKVTLVGPNTIERSQGKAKRILDLRNEK
ncbi:phenylacetate--CoA ligase family protein [Feifania hominis]|uniref:Phenylacetate-coenzyme A ligase n=1 Tax=Feifania hominis TaxID=2763660 RepID=A0A926HPV2_9FIRM|nr:phenylacetate--CoA ligase [Feifania hominis]MBC8535667.1 phenylacetate--CoA ligase [Feifania hominis]